MHFSGRRRREVHYFAAARVSLQLREKANTRLEIFCFIRNYSFPCEKFKTKPYTFNIIPLKNSKHVHMFLQILYKIVCWHWFCKNNIITNMKVSKTHKCKNCESKTATLTFQRRRRVCSLICIYARGRARVYARVRRSSSHRWITNILSSQRSLIQQSPIETTHEERLTAAEVVLAEIGGSTRPILPKPHLIIPIEREQERGEERREEKTGKDQAMRRGQRRRVGEYMETAKFSVSSLYIYPKVPDDVVDQ